MSKSQVVAVGLLTLLTPSIVHSQPVGPLEGELPETVEQDDSAPRSVELSDDFRQLFDKIDELRRSGNVTRTRAVGGRRGGAFECLPLEPSVLTGIEYTASRHYAGHLTIKAIRPIYATRSGETVGEWRGVPWGKARRVVAEDGYVLAGIIAKYGNRVDGIRLVFMKVQQGRLNPDDTYRSDWIGGRRGSPEVQVSANGHPIIGIYGRKGADLDALGFIQVDNSPRPVPARSLKALLPKLAGTWNVVYTNGTQHTRQIDLNQRVNESDEIVQQGDDVLIVFADVVERVTLADDRLFVEHFNPRSTYPDGQPVVMGVGTKLAAD